MRAIATEMSASVQAWRRNGEDRGCGWESGIAILNAPERNGEAYKGAIRVKWLSDGRVIRVNNWQV